MARIVPCARCDRGRVVWTGDEFQCLQCGWLPPETVTGARTTDDARPGLRPERAA